MRRQNSKKYIRKKGDMNKKEILKYYNKCMVCIRCGNNYGSDMPQDNRVCPICELELGMRNGGRHKKILNTFKKINN